MRCLVLLILVFLLLAGGCRSTDPSFHNSQIQLLADQIQLLEQELAAAQESGDAEYIEMLERELEELKRLAEMEQAYLQAN
ncbi:hypothetical protein JW859_11580 [bacterium]|nr:hypothetical protein [bacterium]